jgi:hypothetical protein
LQPVSLFKASLEAAQVICVVDDFPLFRETVDLANDGASGISGNDERVEGTTSLRIDNLHNVPALGWVSSRLIRHGDWVLLRCLHTSNSPKSSFYSLAK